MFSVYSQGWGVPLGSGLRSFLGRREGGIPPSLSSQVLSIWVWGDGGVLPSPVTGPVQSPVPGPARGEGVPPSPVTGPVPGPGGEGCTPARTGLIPPPARTGIPPPHTHTGQEHPVPPS